MSGRTGPVGFAGLADLASDVAADVDAAERVLRAAVSPPVPRSPAPSPQPVAKNLKPSVPIGFAGLAYLASDVAADVHAAERDVRAAVNPRVPRSPVPPPRPVTKSATASSAIGAIFKAIPAKVRLFGGGAALLWMCNAWMSTSFTPSATSPGNNSYVVPTSTDTTDRTADYVEEKPPIGSGQTLSTNEVRYCVFEDERIGYMKPLVTDNDRVNVFNMYVQDYNSRCSSFRYRSGTLDEVRREASQRSASLYEEARRRFY